MSASLAPECSQMKERYDTCFLNWYSESWFWQEDIVVRWLMDPEFLRGNAKTDECEHLFKAYKTCLSNALKERGLDKMIEEARVDNQDNDDEHLRPGYRPPS